MWLHVKDHNINSAHFHLLSAHKEGPGVHGCWAVKHGNNLSDILVGAASETEGEGFAS